MGDPIDSGTLFDGMNCDEMADFELFVGPTHFIEEFKDQAAKSIQVGWRGPNSAGLADYDRTVLALWEDGGPWAAGLFRMQDTDEEDASAPGNMGWGPEGNGQGAPSPHPSPGGCAWAVWVH